jgi:hypothetical protein
MIMEWPCPLRIMIPQTLRAFRSSLALSFSIEFWHRPVSLRMKDNSQYFFLAVSACSLCFSKTPDNVDEYLVMRWASRYVIQTS